MLKVKTIKKLKIMISPLFCELDNSEKGSFSGTKSSVFAFVCLLVSSKATATNHPVFCCVRSWQQWLQVIKFGVAWSRIKVIKRSKLILGQNKLRSSCHFVPNNGGIKQSEQVSPVLFVCLCVIRMTRK